jgi:putative addiction module component (TIGR02574 family)
MSAPLEFRSLPIEERLRLVEAIWDSIEEDQHSFPDDASVIGEVRERKTRYLAHPGTGVAWETAKTQLRPGRD